jgi:hypothetical protein
MPHKTSCKYFLLCNFMENSIFSDFYGNKYGKPPVIVPFLSIPGRLGGLNDSQATNRSAQDGGLTQWESTLCLLLVIWESNMNPIHVMHVYIAALIRVSG